MQEINDQIIILTFLVIFKHCAHVVAAEQLSVWCTDLTLCKVMTDMLVALRESLGDTDIELLVLSLVVVHST